MELREDAEESLVGADAGVRDARVNVLDEVIEGETDTLGVAGGAGRIEDDSQVGGGGSRGVVLAGHERLGVKRQAAQADSLDRLGEVLGRDDQVEPGVLDDLREFGGAEQEVQRNGRPAGIPAGQDRNGAGGGVRREDTDVGLWGLSVDLAGQLRRDGTEALVVERQALIADGGMGSTGSTVDLERIQ